VQESEFPDFLGPDWTPKGDVHAFASILFEIVVGRPATGETSLPANIPAFVSNIIKSELWSSSTTQYSFNVIFEILKANEFRILEDVDSAEVLAFVKSVESTEFPYQ
jgi:hypothetical protein